MSNKTSLFCPIAACSYLSHSNNVTPFSSCCTTTNPTVNHSLFINYVPHIQFKSSSSSQMLNISLVTLRNFSCAWSTNFQKSLLIATQVHRVDPHTKLQSSRSFKQIIINLVYVYFSYPLVRVSKIYNSRWLFIPYMVTEGIYHRS